MRKLGLSDGLIDTLVCPIGLTEIKDKAPAAIAASVAAQLLVVRDSLAPASAAEHRGPSASARRRGGTHA
jgi:xanthine dehydrogenase accessory factor